MQNKIIHIADHFKEDTQKKKLQEEVCELLVADALPDDKEFVGECADVIILIMQRLHQRGLTEAYLEYMINFKLDRTLDRIKEGYYDKRY